MAKLAEPACKHPNESIQKLLNETYEWTNQCVQCGYCLPACPTYASMGKESASPRGRINLVKMATEGKIDVVEHLANPIDLCLGCRACEVACPVGVPYGHMLEVAKEAIAEAQTNEKRADTNLLKKTALNHLFPYPKRMRAIGNMVWMYQKTGLNKLVQKTKVMQKISEPLAQMEKILPAVESPKRRTPRGSVFPAKGVKKARVALFVGCIMDAVMTKTNRLTIELLTSVGCEVVIPEAQNCCGALHAHQGETNQARELAKANIRAFQASEADYYVNNAGGCGAALSEYNHLLKQDEEWNKRAQQFTEKSKDISQLLYQYGPLPFQTNWNGVVVYQDSCHLRNVQKVSKEPRLLLQSIPGATYVELEGADSCCASGGIYNLLHFDESMKILDQKMEQVSKTKATTVVTANPGCHLQMSLGIERQGSSEQIRSLHLVDVLAEACGIK
ncbi:(Fe-S)-binding protein [Bacillus massiliigorillae]|uniref:(Fe-S)-binding protein n=1 Tax=Bacillus massiliigorillae TaxID=1243664 RepID=UPI0003A74024|nr:(Fe-S)-binding protein [Bacillus massiliigorillae]